MISMNDNRDIINSILLSFDITLDDQKLEELENRLEGQRILLETLSSREDIERFALTAKWSACQDNKNLNAIPSKLNNISMSNTITSINSSFSAHQAPAPMESVERSLTAIKSKQWANVFIEVFEEQAKREAQALEHHGDSNLPLSGTTVAVKDLIAIKGRRMTCGSITRNQPLAYSEALAVERLRRAGSIVIGAANLHELAFGTTSINPHFGAVANPVQKRYLAGGSSGGSAAAVRFGMSSFALGTDTGGSVRIPAACCGVVGFKPSFNLVPTNGVYPLGYTLDHIGTLTSTVRQAAVVTEIMLDRPSLFSSQLQEGTLDGLRIGVPNHFFLEEIDNDVKEVYFNALQTLEKKGANLVQVDLPLHSLAPAVYLCTSGTEAAGIHFQRLMREGSKLGDDVFIRLLGALFIPAFARVLAQRVRHLMYEELESIFTTIDILATPTLAISVPEQDEKTRELGGRSIDVGSILLRNTSPFNLTGVPSVSIPAGSDRNGMPVGLQLVCSYLQDLILLKYSHIIENSLR
jgi:aspartyl-tRNA(Asn)/glutamyl-tRNA(Gln) amidotransferase subunit A